MTIELDQFTVPAGWIGIEAQNRAIPVDKIIDVQGQIAGGTIIYLEHGREVSLRADINEVLRAIDDASWGPGSPVTIYDDTAKPASPALTVSA